MSALAWMTRQLAKAPTRRLPVITSGVVEDDVGQLVAFVRRQGSVSQRDVRDGLGWSYDQVRRRLKVAVDHKRLVVSGKTSDRRYRVPRARITTQEGS